MSLVASELLAHVLQWENHDLEEAINGIQHGLDDFETGSFRSFQAFAEEQHHKHNLEAD